MPKSLRATLALFLLAASAVAPAARAQGEADPARAITRYQDYLARKPYHDTAFTKMVEAAVALNRLPALTKEYEDALASDPENVASRVVLARLYAAADKEREALETLAEVAGEDAALHKLVGELHLERNAIPEALAALARAAELSKDRDQLEEIHKRRGAAFLAAGKRKEAHEAFRALAELDPENFSLRLEAAAALAQNRLHEEALAEFATAERLAGDDAAKRCRVLSEIGRLHELRAEGEAALAVYERAIALMARGNWLKRDLYERVLSIHKRANKLAELVAKSGAAAQANAKDLDAREFHADVLAAADKLPEARDVLRAAAGDFKDDVKLSRRLIEVLTKLRDTDGVVAEYQRILGEKPDELELYLELGQVFAADGRLAQARVQWNHTLERRLSDAGMCVRLGELYAHYGMTDDAIAMFEKAIALEPREMRHFSDLASYLARADRRDAIVPLLERATVAAGDDPGRLEELANLWRAQEDLPRARAALEKALVAKPKEGRLLRALADVLIDSGETAPASDALHAVIEHAEDTALRNGAVERLVKLYRDLRKTDELIQREESALASDANAIAPYYVLAQIWVQRRDTDRALEYLQKLLERDPGDEDARMVTARILEEQGEPRAALEQFKTLIEKRPQNRRRYLKELARIHLALYEQDAAFACYDEMLRDAPDNPAAFKEVAKAYEALGLNDKALECWQQAVRLRPDDGRNRLDLAKLYRRLGEWDKARVEIQAVVLSKDDEIRADARKALYNLLSESGLLDGEIASLKKRIDDNPYDDAAPLELCDLYTRELEYELALELLDKQLLIQPKGPKLLAERARILDAMERYDEAIADWESLWKLPDSDRDDLTLDIGEASIKKGDVEGARKLLAGLGDVARVAGLFAKHDLHDEAIAVLERGLARNPGDVKLTMRLGRALEAIGEREQAAIAYERALGRQADSWRVLTKLGQLYHDLGRKEDVLECGTRMFALLRVDEPIEEDKDDDEDDEEEEVDSWSLTYYASQGTTAQLAERLNELNDFYESKGLLAQFCEAGAREVALQPTNVTLLQSVTSSYRQLGERGADARAMLRGVRAATEKSGRRPQNYTKYAWGLYLDGQELALFSSDPKFVEARTAELEPRIGVDATEAEWLELAHLYGLAHKDAERLALVQRAAEQFPASIRAQVACARLLHGEKKWAEAVPYYAGAVALLEKLPADSDERRDEALGIELRFRQQRTQLLQQFPVHLRKKVDEATLRRVFDMQNGPSTACEWTAGQRIALDGVRRQHAACLLELDKNDEARAILRSLEPTNPEFSRRWSDLAAVYFTNELFDDAEAIYRRMVETELRLAQEPLIGFTSAWRQTASSYYDPTMGHVVSSGGSGSLANYARVLEKRGEILEAYDVLRRYGSASAGELLLTQNSAFDAAKERYAREMGELEARLPAPGVWDALVNEWRNATIKLAEIHQIQKEWDRVLALFERIATQLPDDFDILEAIATQHVRAGRFDDAIATHYRIIERKRAKNREADRPKAPRGIVLTPRAPQITSNEDWTLSNLRYSGSGGTGVQFDPRENYVEILKIHLDRKQGHKIADLLRDLARTDASAMRWMSWTLIEMVQSSALGDEALPILRLLYGYEPDNTQLGCEYGKKLAAAKKLEEAERVLSRVVQKARPDDYYAEEARQELAHVEAELGLARPETLADLRAKVAADPKNVKSRMKLARELFEERDWSGALEHAREAETLAPHQEDVIAFVDDCLQALGKLDDLRPRMEKALAKATDQDEKFALAVKLADWARERGEPQAVEALFEKASDSVSGWNAYAPSSWYLEKGDYERARSEVERELERMGKRASQSASARTRLQALHLFVGDLEAALDILWQEIADFRSFGDKAAIVGRIAGLLRRLPDLQAAREPFAQLTAKYEGTRRKLYEAGYALACSDLAGLEKLIDELVQSDSETSYLYPLLVSLARERGDLEAALGYLARLETLGLASEGRTVSTNIGSLSERNALRAEKGSLLFELGRKEEGIAEWEAMFQPDDEDGRAILASLFAEFELWEDAARVVQARVDKHGERNYSDLTRLATWSIERGDVAGAIPLLERALVLSNRSAAVRAQLRSAYRKLERLAEYYAGLEAEAAKDSEDVDLQRHMISVALELGRDADALSRTEALYARSDQAQAVAPFLARTCLLQGKPERALEVLEQRLEGNLEDYERRQVGRQLANWCFERKDAERALALLEKGHVSATRLELDQAAVELLGQWQLYELQLARCESALAVAPKNADLLAARVTALTELGRAREALDATLVWLSSPERMWESDFDRGSLARLALAAGEHERVQSELARTPEDVELRWRAGLLALLDGDATAALAHLEFATRARPEDVGVLSALSMAQRDLERYADARATYARLIDVFDRLQGLGNEDWRVSQSVESVDQARLATHLLEGDQEAARRWLAEPSGERFRTVSAWNYSYDNNPLERLSNRCWRLSSHGLYGLLFEARKKLSWFEHWNQQYSDSQILEARFRSGAREAALEDAWRAVVDVSTAFIVAPSSRNYFYSSDGQADWRVGALRRCFSEEARMPELYERLARELERRPKDEGLKKLRESVLVADERWEDVLALRRERLDKTPDDPTRMTDVARALSELGRFDEALPLLERVLALEDAEVSFGVTERVWVPSTTGAKPLRGVRFAWGASAGSMLMGTSSTTYYSMNSSGAGSSTARRAAMVAYARVGNLERAHALERDDLALAVLDDEWSSRDVRMQLANVYAEGGALAEAERMYLEHAQRSDEARQNALTALIVMYREHGPSESREKYARELLDLLQRSANEIAGAADLPDARLARARVKLFDLDDAAGARVEVEAVLARWPKRVDALSLAAWIALLSGDAKGAARRFEDLERLQLALGHWAGSDLYFGLGLALARSGDRAAAAPHLRRALFAEPKSRWAAEAVALLP